MTTPEWVIKRRQLTCEGVTPKQTTGQSFQRLGKRTLARFTPPNIPWSNSVLQFHPFLARVWNSSSSSKEWDNKLVLHRWPNMPQASACPNKTCHKSQHAQTKHASSLSMPKQNMPQVSACFLFKSSSRPGQEQQCARTEDKFKTGRILTGERVASVWKLLAAKSWKVCYSPKIYFCRRNCRRTEPKILWENFVMNGSIVYFTLKWEFKWAHLHNSQNLFRAQQNLDIDGGWHNWKLVWCVF